MTNIILHQDVCSNWQWLNPEKSFNRCAAGVRSMPHRTQQESTMKLKLCSTNKILPWKLLRFFHWLLMSNIFWDNSPPLHPHLQRTEFIDCNFSISIFFCVCFLIFLISFPLLFNIPNFSLTTLMGTHLWKSFKGPRTMNVPHQCHRQHLLQRNNTPGTTVDLLCFGENKIAPWNFLLLTPPLSLIFVHYASSVFTFSLIKIWMYVVFNTEIPPARSHRWNHWIRRFSMAINRPTTPKVTAAIAAVIRPTTHPTQKISIWLTLL